MCNLFESFVNSIAIHAVTSHDAVETRATLAKPDHNHMHIHAYSCECDRPRSSTLENTLHARAL